MCSMLMKQGYTPTDDVIEWFWKIVKSWPAEKQTRLLQFTTGESLGRSSLFPADRKVHLDL